MTDGAPTDSASPNGSDPLDEFESLARRRRSNLRVDPDRAVPDELVDRLCRIAVWAPNHRQTWPWQFAAITGEARGRLGQVIADAMERVGGFDEVKVAKNRSKYLRAPVVLAVGSAPAPKPSLTAENRDAVAAAVQTLLLAATTAGLNSFWSSCAPDLWPAVSNFCGFEPATAVIALVYLGWPIGEVPVPERPLPDIVHLGG